MNIKKFLRKAFFHRTPPVAASGLYNYLSKSLRRPFSYFLYFNPSSKRLREAVVCRCFAKKGVCKFLQVLQETPMLESLFNIVVGLKAYNFIKKRPQKRRFRAILCNCREHLFKEHLWWLLLGSIQI